MIFGGWGLTTGLTFWAAVIKRVTMIAGTHEQGRFFGFLDGGRGLIEAMLATVAITLFAWATQTHRRADGGGLQARGLPVRVPVHRTGRRARAREGPASRWRDASPSAPREQRSNVLIDLKTLAAHSRAVAGRGHRVLRLSGVLGDLQLLRLSARGGIGLTVVMAGTITTLKLWMRPIGGIGGGFLGDRFSKVSVLVIALFLAALSLRGADAPRRASRATRRCVVASCCSSAS